MSTREGRVLLVAAMVAAVPVAGWSQIDEIVVTTRKKEELLQDVPIAVSAITADQIARQGVADLGDIASSDPSVQFDRSFGPSDTRVTIRGLSNTRGRSNVAFLVDGIDVTTENLIVSGSGLLANRRLLTDVERIELVKGPQSALYGRAAFAGAISYITKEPGDVFDATARLDVAQDGFQQVDAAMGGPLSDSFGVRLTGFWYNQDGHYVNAMSGDDVGGSGGSGAALTGVWKPTDLIKIKMRGEYSREDYDPLANVRIGGGWQEGPDIKLHELPQSILQNAAYRLIGWSPINALGASASGDSTGLLDFAQYCPESLQDGSRGPGLCLPTSYGSAKGRVVKHSENPLTGQDFDGTDLQTFRFSVVSTLELPFGEVTSLTGVTNFDASDNYDQDWQAEGIGYTYSPFYWAPRAVDQDDVRDGVARPSPVSIPLTPSPSFYNGRVADQLLSGQIANTESEVNQFSQEFRFSSDFDGPVNFTLGALFWDERRELLDSNAIMACMPIDKTGNALFLGDINNVRPEDFRLPEFYYQDSDAGNGGNTSGNVCDGGLNNNGFPTVIGWQEYYRQLQPQRASEWEADTRHWSLYGQINWDFAENWSLSLEDRVVAESFRLRKPNQSTCTNLGYIAVIGQSFRAEDGNFDATCAYVEITTPVDNLPPGSIGNTDTIRPIEATTTSHYHTPKVTLNWKPLPDTLLYFYWADAQKPGGINQLAGGGSAVIAKSERFLPEKMQVWELGTKNTFELGGPLQANAAFFFQDYTDKQVNTQVIDASGTSQPRVLNASGAEIWGAELDVTWKPDLVDGLTLNVAYTYLDATYTEFVDDITSVQRIAYIADRGCTLVYKDRFGNEIFELNGPNPDIISAACRADLSGAQLERTPEHAVSAQASYRRPLGDGDVDLLTEVAANWQDKRYLDPENGLYFEEYWNVDLRVGLLAERFEVIAYLDNALDDDTIKSGGSGPDFGRQVSETGFTAGLGVSHFFGTLPDPRIFGIRLKYNFGGE